MAFPSKAIALLALSVAAARAHNHTSSHPNLVSFVVEHESFNQILGNAASVTLLYNASEPLFHEGAVYLKEADTLFVTSNRINLPANQADSTTSNQAIKFSAVRNVSATPGSPAITVSPLDTSTIALPNGGVLDKSAGGLLWCAQGSKTKPSGIYSIPDPLNAPNTSVVLVKDFYGRQFNGPNDVVANPADDGASIYFTDPDYTFSQGLRNAPQLKNHVYRYDVAHNATRVVADDFYKPNGLAFNADGSILYITDGSADADTNAQGAATIYAFDVNGAFLENRRLFAFAPKGIPDGIKVDAAGNVWSGTGAGVVVWNKDGTQLGQIKLEGGAANFGFGQTEKTVFILGEKQLWRAQLS